MFNGDMCRCSQLGSVNGVEQCLLEHWQFCPPSHIPCLLSDRVQYMLFALQVQTLYYLGSAGNGRRKRSAAAAAQGAAVVDTSTAEPEAAEEPTGKKGGKRSKRRKKAAAGKENSVPPEDAGAVQKEGSPPAADEEVQAYALDFDSSASMFGCFMP